MDRIIRRIKQRLMFTTLLGKAFDEIIGAIKAKLSSLAEVGHATCILTEEDVGESAIVVGLGQAGFEGDGFVVAHDGGTIVLKPREHVAPIIIGIPIRRRSFR